MEFAFSEEQQELAATVRSLLAKRADSAAVRAAMGSKTGYDEFTFPSINDSPQAVVGAGDQLVPERGRHQQPMAQHDHRPLPAGVRIPDCSGRQLDLSHRLSPAGHRR